MNHRFSSTKVVLDILAQAIELSATEIAEKAWKSRAIIHTYLKSLVSEGKIKKIGLPPHTRYQLLWNEHLLSKIESISQIQDTDIPFREQKILDEIFFRFSPTGKKYEWFQGFREWCKERNLKIHTAVKSYLSIYQHIQDSQDSCGLLSADEAFWKNFKSIWLDHVYYADQYNWMEFGRGKLAEITFYGKQSQNKELLRISVDMIHPQLRCLILKEWIDAIAITPWSIDRKNQLLWALKKKLSLFGIPFINIIKYSESGIVIPQKTLKTPEERIENARNTIFIHDKKTSHYKKVLLIDDFVGSGATLNETAKKLKAEWVKEVIGFAWVGNMNLSYDIINEM